MKKILLSVVCLIVVGMQSVKAQATITAPTMPTELTLSDSIECYMLNVGTERFLGSSYDPARVDIYGEKITIKMQAEGEYTLQRMSDELYFYTYSDNISQTTSTGTESRFKFTKVDGGYNIQRLYNYSEAEYVGAVTNDYRVYSNHKEDNIVWKLLPATEVTEVYMAKLHLYHLLLSAQVFEGCNFDKFTAVYNNTSSTAEELKTASTQLDRAMSLTTYFSGMNAQSDYPMLFENDEVKDWERPETSGNSDAYIYAYLNPEETRTLTATVVVDKEATIRFNPYNDNRYCDRGGDWRTWNNNYYFEGDQTQRYCEMDVYVDDKLVRTINKDELGRDWVFFAELTPGKHTVKWVGRNPSTSNSQYIDLQFIHVFATPKIEVSLAQAGSLGTEVLYNVDNIDKVRNLKVSGPMNADDFAKIDMMPMLFALDLSDAEVTAIADNEFNRDTQNGGKSSKQYLHKIVLPKTLKTIGYRSFRCSCVEDIDFTATALETLGDEAFIGSYVKKAILPETVKTIGNAVFSYCYNLEEAYMPNTVTSLGSEMYNHDYHLRKATFPTSLTSIPDWTFDWCEELEDMPLHDGITSVGQGAFQITYAYNPQLPTSIKSFGERCFIYGGLDSVPLRDSVSIGTAAFKYCKIRNLTIPENAKLGNLCFADNKEMVSVTMPTTYYASNNDSPILRYNDALQTVTLKSPTVVTGNYQDRTLWDCGTAMTIRVPQYLLNSYKQDKFWYNYTLEGFSTADVDTWTINQPLTLFSRDRFEGSPSLVVNGNGYLTINGETAMELNNVQTNEYLSWPWIGSTAMVISNCENVKINGTVTHRAHSYGNRWYYICLPFNFKVSDIVTENGAKFAIRYYDGVSRAASLTNTGNWKDLPMDTVVTAGTGFIYQTSKEDYTIFKAVDDADKQNVMGNQEFAKLLQPNYAEESAHRGWNLVGNPYLAYYNIHKLNFTAPITATVDNYWYNSYSWDYYSNTSYQAYSIVDDDYAIKPLEAFFVQCPDEVNTISFPTAGRQLTATIESQNAAPARRTLTATRKLVDLELSAEDMTDQTRVVFNSQASMEYESACDASKFMSENKMMPQIYTLGGNGIQYAINERPAQDGTVRLGLYIPANGSYTLKVVRNREAGQIYLKDNDFDTVTDITNVPYSFSAEAGKLENRFMLVAGDVTGVREITTSATADQTPSMYDLTGRKVEKGSVHGGIYIIQQNGKTRKVSVK